MQEYVLFPVKVTDVYTGYTCTNYLLCVLYGRENCDSSKLLKIELTTLNMLLTTKTA